MSRILDWQPTKKQRRSKGGGYRRWKRAKLHRAQKGKCYWCGCLTVLIDSAPPGRQPDNMATLEHLDDRYNPDRGKRGGERRVVMACRLCNNLRGRLMQAAVPIEERRRRAANGHEARP